MTVEVGAVDSKAEALGAIAILYDALLHGDACHDIKVSFSAPRALHDLRS